MRRLWGPPQPLLEFTQRAGPARRTLWGDHAVRGSAHAAPVRHSQVIPGDAAETQFPTAESNRAVRRDETTSLQLAQWSSLQSGQGDGPCA